MEIPMTGQPRRSSFSLGTLFLLLGLSLSTHARPLPAQASSATVRVRLAAPTHANAGASNVKRFKSNAQTAVIVLADGDLTPEGVARQLAAFGASRRLDETPTRDMTVRASSPAPRALSTAQRRHYQSMIDRLRAAPVRPVPGVGQARLIEIAVLTAVPGHR
jgi:hypothetical protein